MFQNKVPEKASETIEIRWFESGEVPAEVESWFLSDCLQDTTGEPEARTDFYLYLPESTTVSCKWRQGNLELKWRQAQRGEREFGDAVWSGRVERWYKSLEGESIAQNQLARFVPSKFWIGVRKQRQQREESGVSGELTRLEIDSQLWWSIAFEAIDGDGDRFVKILDRVCKTYCGPQLSLHNCFGYPQLLAEKCLKNSNL
ncbi:hypothetical protein [Myxosarcina sp. GI1(2024)]